MKGTIAGRVGAEKKGDEGGPTYPLGEPLPSCWGFLGPTQRGGGGGGNGIFKLNHKKGGGSRKAEGDCWAFLMRNFFRCRKKGT